MHQLPTQQKLRTLHNKIQNTNYKGKETKEGSSSVVVEKCAKSVESAKRVAVPHSLVAVYAKVGRQHDYLYRQGITQDKIERGYARLLRTLAREYLPALALFQESYPRDVLLAERDRLIERLNKGMDTQAAPDGDESTDRIAELFDRLLIRYSIVHDAVEGDVIMRHMHGLDEWVSAGHV